MNNFIRGLFFGALASVVATPNKPKTPIRGVSHAKYRKMQRSRC